MAAGRSANAGLGGKTAAGESACRRASGANAGEDTGLGGKTAAASAGLAAANGWAANGWPKADCKRTRKLSSFSSYVYVYEYSSSSAIVLQSD